MTLDPKKRHRREHMAVFLLALVAIGVAAYHATSLLRARPVAKPIDGISTPSSEQSVDHRTREAEHLIRERVLAVDTLLARSVVQTSALVEATVERQECLPLPGPPVCFAKVVTVSGIDATPLVSTMDEARNRLLHTLPGDELAPMRAYVEARFPAREQLLVQLQPMPTIDKRLLVSPDRARSVVDHASKVIATLKSITTYVIDLEWSSEPSGARVELIGGKKQLRDTLSTPSRMPSVWRGDYTYNVKRTGYKPILGEPLNLVDRTPKRLRCALRAEKSPDDAIPCTQEF